MGELNWMTKARGIFLLWAAAAVVLPAQNSPITSTAPVFTSLHSFNGTDGGHPYAGLVQAADGNFYGTTSEGGNFDCAYFGCGTIFKITPSGTLTSLYIFCSQTDCPDGIYPRAALIQGTDGNFYGTAGGGGDINCIPDYGGCGTVFRITLSGTFTTLHSFSDTDGAFPEAGLIQGADGNFYGTTVEGGANGSCYGGEGCGTVFRMTPGGAVTTLYSFCSHSNCTDGTFPDAGLIQGADGNFYGTTSIGGHSNSKYCGPYAYGYTCGTVFRITPSGIFTTLHRFCSQAGCRDGANPYAALVQGTDGNFYGTTEYGGANDSCYEGYGCGTVFKITSDGSLTSLHSFNGTDGAFPEASLVWDTDGNFYGTTVTGGTSVCGGIGCGTVFELSPTGTLTMLHSFDGTDGQDLQGGLLQGTDGTFYGTTVVGAANDCPNGSGCGTVFSLSVGLGPFVKTNPAAGKVGATVGILGTNLTGATGVEFDGTETAFRVVSSSFIEAKVPSGATTGTVQVQLPSGTLSSNAPFIVLP